MPEPLAKRLVRLRAELAKQRLDGLVIGREDMFQGEEVPPGDERLAYISGFSGSAGYALSRQMPQCCSAMGDIVCKWCRKLIRQIGSVIRCRNIV